MRSHFGAATALCLSAVCLGLLSCSGSSHPTTPPPVTPATPDFSLAATPATVTLTSGATGTAISVAAAALNGFTGPVAVTASGLPAGVTFTPATVSLTPGAAQTMTLTAASTAGAGAATITLTGTSGTLSHTAAIALTVAAPPPDFALTVSPATLSLTAGGAGAQVSVLATPANSFTGAVTVAITGLPTGVTANPASLTLTPGTAQSVTLTAAAATAAGAATVTFTGTSGTLSHPATLALTVQAAVLTNAPDVPTYHYDNARDGLNASETILNLTNVNATQFGKIGFDTVDGKVDAEPLYIANITVGGALRNVLYVATEHDSVYAFDADTGAQLWMTSILGNGETTSDDHGCDQITPEIGITSTPVIDRKQGPNGTLFTVGMTKDASGAYHHRLHALDLTTGTEISGSPTEITGTYPGTGANSQGGNVVFDPAQYAERAALLLLNGNIYLAWTSHCDVQPYTGWIMGYSESTLQQTQILNVTPNGSEGSIWMSGDGLAADSSGNIYFLDANGTFDTTLTSGGLPSGGDYGNAIIKLSTSGTLAVTDYFNEYNTVMESGADTDLGSGGEILLPDLTDATGTVHHLIVGAGKDMNIYLADRDNMGKYNSTGDSNIYQQVSGQLTGKVFSTPAYFNNTIYYAAIADTLKAFPLTNAQLAAAPSSQSPTPFPYPGATPGISANGTTNGIVWALESTLTSPGVLHAYDATNLTSELYNSNQASGGRDAFGDGNKFVTPLIVNGKVYVGTQTGVAVFGLIPSS
ncbi:hypothetical protein ACPOL_6795 (plasmid) [Acidisarcina polymorpha]|uniref:Cell surface protein n=1 Tax=Acidisarcina polymorpha TaxID=2211140 RepID=A0A2Z5GBJ9_9BACT|nr:hypothetical protein ACPOL_6795 [Acidisarcina polymorpha]